MLVMLNKLYLLYFFLFVRKMKIKKINIRINKNKGGEIKKYDR